uniref:GCR076 n=1 Tax=Schmidtea mediterranea TaxID=79327 RepID=A0A193KUI7_SCHMD|nr:GCR076 [Schmidtea mediterranea]
MFENLSTRNNYTDIYSNKLLNLYSDFKYPFVDRIKIIITTIFSLSILVTLIGNGMLFFVIFQKKSSRNVTNILMVNLSVVQLLISFIVIPANLVKFWNFAQWPFGVGSCYFVSFMHVLTMYASSYTLVAIAYFRYQSQNWTGRLRLFVTISVIWGLSIMIAFPHLFFIITNKNLSLQNFFKLHLTGSKNFMSCKILFPFKWRVWIILTNFLLQYFIPLVAIIYMYACVAHRIWKAKPVRSKFGQIITFSSGSSSEQSYDTYRRNIFIQQIYFRQRRSNIDYVIKKSTILMLVIVTLFFISWAPFHIYLFLTALRIPHNFFIYYILYWLAFSNIWYNPIVYYWVNKNNVNLLKYVLRRCCICICIK